MLFVQTNAPLGWTKITTHNDKALRVVSGTVGSGGSVAFTTAFSAGTLPVITNSHTLTTAEIPAHTHAENTQAGAAFGDVGGLNDRQNIPASGIGDSNQAAILTTSTGGDGGHTHGITVPSLAVNYVDVIFASKD
jgi:microcystin-dependent protein